MSARLPPSLAAGRRRSAGLRFAAQRRELPGRLRPRAAAGRGAPRRGHARRPPLRLRATPRGDADRGACSRVRYIDPNRGLADIDLELIDGVWPEPVARVAQDDAGNRPRLARRARAVHRCTHASSPCGEVRARIDDCYLPVPRGARGGSRRRPSRVRRGLARQLSFDACGRRCERRRSGPRARGFRAGRPRRHDLRAGVHARGRRHPARDGLRRRDQRPLQGRRDRAPARAARGEPAQPADRDQSPVVHGRDRRWRRTQAIRRSSAISIGSSPGSLRSCVRNSATGCDWSIGLTTSGFRGGRLTAACAGPPRWRAFAALRYNCSVLQARRPFPGGTARLGTKWA